MGIRSSQSENGGAPRVSAGVHEGRGLESGLGIVRRVPERPREEAQLERAAVPDGAFVARRRRSCWPPSSRGPRARARPWRSASSRTTRCRRSPPCRSPTPGDGIHAMVSAPSSASGTRKLTSPFGAEAAAAVLVDDHVAAGGEPAALAERGLGLRLVVGRAVQEDGERVGHRAPVAGGTIDVGGQAHAVAHGHRHVLGHVHVELGARRPDGGVERLHVEGWLLCARCRCSGDVDAVVPVPSLPRGSRARPAGC